MKVAVVAAVLSLGLGLAAGCARPAGTADVVPRGEIDRRIGALLGAYAANDQTAVIGLLDSAGFVIFGSDASEIVRTHDELRQLMADDFRLWGSARFGPIRDLDVRGNGAIATAVFHVPFSAGGGPEVLVRFSTAWRRVDGDWRLMQSANTVPTVGSSARELAE